MQSCCLAVSFDKLKLGHVLHAARANIDAYKKEQLPIFISNVPNAHAKKNHMASVARLHEPGGKDKLERARDFALAFCMVTHSRLGKGSMFRDLDPDVVQIVAQYVIEDDLWDYMCCGYIPVLFEHICHDAMLRKDVAELLLARGDDATTMLLRGRVLTTEEAAAFENGSVVAAEDKPMANLGNVVWEARKARQQCIENMHRLRYCDKSEQSLGEEVYIELGEQSRLLLASEICDAEACTLHHDFDGEDEDSPAIEEEGWDHAAHLFVANREDIDVAEVMKDLASHMAHVVQMHAGDKSSRQLLLAPLVAEALMVQACLFPIYDDATMVGDTGNAPSFSEQPGIPSYDMTMWLEFCHEYEADLVEHKGRACSSFAVDIHVFRGGNLVRIAYNWDDNTASASTGCRCKWCNSFSDRHPELCVRTCP